MDSDEKSICNKNSDMWDWKEDDYCLNETTKNDISRCLWDEVSQSEDSLMYLLEEQTPIKDCTDFGYQIVNIDENINKLLEECRDFSQQKRRRVLHFPRDAGENAVCKVQPTSIFLRSKEREDEQIDDGPSSSANVEWSSQWDIGLSDGSCAFNSEAWDQESDGWLDDCLDSSMMQCKIDETSTPIKDLNCDEASNHEIQITECNNFSSDKDSDLVQQKSWPSSLPKLLKGKKFMIGTTTKLTTSVAYPFALIKPCGVGADLTLQDINRRLHNPLSTRTKFMEDENSLLSYPTSAFSGKPVVVKTKIRTEGGRGSITIMRTKG